VHAAIAHKAGFKLAAEHGVGSLEQHFDIATREHRGDIAGAGRLRRAAGRIGIDLDGLGRRGKAGADERFARGIGIAHEMAEVIEEDLIADRKLAVGL